MLYEVTTQLGRSYIIEASSSKEAKEKVCKDLNIKLSDYRYGISSMQARKADVDYPEVCYRPLDDAEVLLQYEGRDVILYDEHHGTATRIRKATVGLIQYYLDEYTTIIAL